MQVVPDLVDRAGLGLQELTCGGRECVFFEEEADLVARGQEIVITDMVVVASGELRLWVHASVSTVAMQIGRAGVREGDPQG